MSDEKKDAIAREVEAQKARQRGEATHPENLPGVDDGKKAKSYEELSEEEKEVAAAISQDWDA